MIKAIPSPTYSYVFSLIRKKRNIKIPGQLKNYLIQLLILESLPKQDIKKGFFNAKKADDCDF